MLAGKSTVARGVIVLLAFLLALLTLDTPAHAASYTPASGVGAVKAGGTTGGGQGSTYHWKVYGKGRSTPFGTPSPAWKSFVKKSHKPCGTNCRRNFTGEGKYNWKGIDATCKSSAYIWAKVLDSGYINQRGYPQSPKSIGKVLPKHGQKGARAYKQFRTEAVAYLKYVVPKKSRYVVILCSGALG